MYLKHSGPQNQISTYISYTHINNSRIYFVVNGIGNGASSRGLNSTLPETESVVAILIYGKYISFICGLYRGMRFLCRGLCSSTYIKTKTRSNSISFSESLGIFIYFSCKFDAHLAGWYKHCNIHTLSLNFTLRFYPILYMKILNVADSYVRRIKSPPRFCTDKYIENIFLAKVEDAY